MGIFLVTPVSPFPTAVGASFGTFTTRQDVSPQPLPAIQGGTLQLGTKIKIEAEGEISSTGSPTIILGLYIGTIAGAIALPIAETGTITMATAVAWPWRLEWRGIVTGLGTAGTIVGQGDCEVGTSLTAFTTTAIPITQALRTFAWDTTINRAIGVCATWSASSGSNTIRTNNLSVMLLNGP
jgi:hypothetical protein